MALITCPECHNEVSDSSTTCIHCGFSLIDHFNRQKMEDELQVELSEKLYQIETMSRPSKPNIFGRHYILTAFSLLFLVVGIFCLALSKDIPSNFALGLICVLVSVTVFGFTLWVFKYEMLHYKNQISDWEKYKESEKIKLIEQYKTYSENIKKFGGRDAKSKQEEHGEEYVVRCPVCGSPNVKKISGVKKVVSTELWGLASSDIGKQMECENCGYKF